MPTSGQMQMHRHREDFVSLQDLEQLRKNWLIISKRHLRKIVRRHRHALRIVGPENSWKIPSKCVPTLIQLVIESCMLPSKTRERSLAGLLVRFSTAWDQLAQADAEKGSQLYRAERVLQQQRDQFARFVQRSKQVAATSAEAARKLEAGTKSENAPTEPKPTTPEESFANSAEFGPFYSPRIQIPRWLMLCFWAFSGVLALVALLVFLDKGESAINKFIQKFTSVMEANNKVEMTVANLSENLEAQASQLAATTSVVKQNATGLRELAELQSKHLQVTAESLIGTNAVGEQTKLNLLDSNMRANDQTSKCNAHR